MNNENALTLTTSFHNTSPQTREDIPNTIYFTTDPKQNDLKFQIDLSDEIQFLPGDPVKISAASSATYSLIYIDTSQFKATDAILKLISSGNPDWSIAYFDEDKHLCFSPCEKNGFKSRSQIIKLSNFILPQTTQSQIITPSVRAYNLTTKILYDTPSVNLLPYPDRNNNLNYYFNVKATPTTVISSLKDQEKIKNSFTINFSSNGAPFDPIPVTPDTKFSFQFPLGSYPGENALLSEINLADVKINCSDSRWRKPEIDVVNKTINTWPLTNFALDDRTTIDFMITDLETDFVAGPCLVNLIYQKVAGIKNGSFSTSITKVRQAEIAALTVSPGWAELSPLHADVTVSWSVPTQGCVLTLRWPGNQEDVTNNGAHHVTTQIDETTEFTLSVEQNVQGSGGDMAKFTISKRCVAYVVPKIEFFTATRTNASADEFAVAGSVKTTLKWRVTNTKKGVFLYDWVTRDFKPYPAVHEETITVPSPRLYSLLVDALPITPIQSKSIFVGQWTPSITASTLGVFNTLMLRASRDCGYVAGAGPASGMGWACPPKFLQKYHPDKLIKYKNSGLESASCIAFSTDGRKFYSASQETTRFTRGFLGEVDVAESPREMTFTVIGSGSFTPVAIGAGTGYAVLVAGTDASHPKELLFSSCLESTRKIWNQRAYTIPRPEKVAIHAAPDGQRVLICSDTFDVIVTSFEETGLTTPVTLPNSKGATLATFTDDCGAAIIAFPDGRVLSYALSPPRLLRDYGRPYDQGAAAIALWDEKTAMLLDYTGDPDHASVKMLNLDSAAAIATSLPNTLARNPIQASTHVARQTRLMVGYEYGEFNRIDFELYHPSSATRIIKGATDLAFTKHQNVSRLVVWRGVATSQTDDEAPDGPTAAIAPSTEASSSGDIDTGFWVCDPQALDTATFYPVEHEVGAGVVSTGESLPIFVAMSADRTTITVYRVTDGSKQIEFSPVAPPTMGETVAQIQGIALNRNGNILYITTKGGEGSEGFGLLAYAIGTASLLSAVNLPVSSTGQVHKTFICPADDTPTIYLAIKQNRMNSLVTVAWKDGQLVVEKSTPIDSNNIFQGIWKMPGDGPILWASALRGESAFFIAIDPKTGSIHDLSPISPRTSGLGMTADGTKLVLSNDLSDGAFLYDLATGGIVQKLDPDGNYGLEGFACSPCGQYIAAMEFTNHFLQIFQANGGQAAST